MSFSQDRSSDIFKIRLNYLSVRLGFVFCCSVFISLLFLFFDMRGLINPACAEQLMVRNNIYLFLNVIPDVLMVLGVSFAVFPVVFSAKSRKKQKESSIPNNGNGVPHE